MELLDLEGIASVAVMGLSGGSPAAIRFAQDHADRCWALVLISSAVTTLPPLPPLFRLAVRVQDFMMRFDPLWVLIYRYGLGLMLRSNGVYPKQVAQIFRDPHLLSVARGIYRPLTSSSARREGFRLDDAVLMSLPETLDYEIDVPTLISHAANDPLAPAPAAARLAKHISGAEYLEMPDGGHVFFVVHSTQVIPEIERFLAANGPA